LIVDADSYNRSFLRLCLQSKFRNADVVDGGIYRNCPENCQILIYSEILTVEEVEDWLYEKSPSCTGYTGVVEVGEIK